MARVATGVAVISPGAYASGSPTFLGQAVYLHGSMRNMIRYSSFAALLALAVCCSSTLAQPFQLSPVEQQYLDQVLQLWEVESGKINTFSCNFTRLVYDPVFGPGADLHKNEEDGTLSYHKPDKGSFEIKKVRAWDAKEQRHVEQPDAIGEHWVCDGKAYYEYKTEQKMLVVRQIPAEMQGQNIVDGPLPFLFGAEADKLKARYWMRIDPRSPENQIRLVAMPKRQSDAANYRMVEVLLDRTRMLPVAMQVHPPGQGRVVYTFDVGQAEVNNRVTQIWNQLFQSPRTPFGWKRVVEPLPTAQAQQPGAERR